MNEYILKLTVNKF